MQDREPDEFRESTSLLQIWLLFRQNRVALFSFYLFFILILVALFPKLIMPYSESMEFVGEELMPPSWVEKGRIAFFFGTDDLGWRRRYPELIQSDHLSSEMVQASGST